jgi:hypothetical protein
LVYYFVYYIHESNPEIMICLSTCLKDDNEVISGKLPLNAACP